MKFEFDTTTDGAKEAAAMAAALGALYGPDISDALDRAVNDFDKSLANDGHPFNAADHASRKSDHFKDEAAHSPVTEDTSAAEAFGESAPAPTPPAPTGALDVAGIPWDDRIHASTKTTNKDGTWTRRRNTPDATFDAVMAELKGTTPAPAAAPNAPPPPTAEAESAPAASVAPTTSADTAPSSVVPPPPPPPTAITFPMLVVKITKAQTAGKIDPPKVLEFLGMFGLSAVKELASAGADTVQAVNAMVDAHIDG